MKIFIITSCTGEKAIKHKRELTIADFQLGRDVVTDRESELADLLTPAESLYTGEQHLRLMKGIQKVNDAGNIDLDFHILSAGYGLIKADRKILPYEATFSTMKKKELVNWANELNIPAHFRTTVGTSYDFGLILLGEKYLEACQLDNIIQFGGPTLLFCSPTVAKQLPLLQNVKVVTLYNPEAKRMSCGLTGLKGELATRILKKIIENGQEFIDQIMISSSPLDLLGKTTEITHTQSIQLSKGSKIKFISLSSEWLTSPHKKKDKILYSR